MADEYRPENATQGLIVLHMGLELAGVGPLETAGIVKQCPWMDHQMHSLSELDEAAKKMGAATRMVWLDPSAPIPTIPIVIDYRSQNVPKRDAPGRFRLLYGTVDGQAQVIDAFDGRIPQAIVNLPQNWSGEGLVLASRPADLASFPMDVRDWRLLSTAAWGTMAIFVALVLWLFDRRRRLGGNQSQIGSSNTNETARQGDGSPHQP